MFKPEHQPYCINLYQVLAESASQMSLNKFFFFLNCDRFLKKSLVSVKYLKSIDPVCKLKKNLSAKRFFTKFLESHT